ncbi:DUF2523 family protein [Hahella sp. HN01]|uniref:DUF2523 family protein n=1 Tax=Hahella sp. HN01 TaxID=2847262 RepID=UPI001C1EA77C|nr:DUF2523 family protein [Hahella sp. HN01]MBU6955540.1 DUF2523 domain-containing protein [Hahella sp. HN01]
MTELLESLLEAWLDVVLWLPRKIFEYVVDVVLYLINMIPVPVDPKVLQTQLNSIDTGVLWFLSIAEFNYALTVIFAALLARFILRRIPGIG